MPVNETYFDTRTQAGSTSIGCLVYTGVKDDPINPEDSGKLVVLKLIDELKSLKKRVDKLEQ